MDLLSPSRSLDICKATAQHIHTMYVLQSNLRAHAAHLPGPVMCINQCIRFWICFRSVVPVTFRRVVVVILDLLFQRERVRTRRRGFQNHEKDTKKLSYLQKKPPCRLELDSLEGGRDARRRRPQTLLPYISSLPVLFSNYDADPLVVGWRDRGLFLL